ncbi:MAG: hypothetical protein QM529_02915, partial [Hydrotalea sp.]|nr:hypothetical protein [Hydrotalea sp.]
MKNFCDPQKLAAKITRANNIKNDRFLFDLASDEVIDHLLPIKQPLKNIFCRNFFVDGFALAPRLQKFYPDSIIDEQATPPDADNKYDAIIDFMAWHYGGDRADDLASYHRALKIGGFFQAVSLGGEGLAELEQSFLRAEMVNNPRATMRFFPRHQVADLIAALGQAKFSAIIADGDHITLTYNDAKTLLTDARAMALTNSLIGIPSYFAQPKLLQQTIKTWLAQNPVPLALRIELLYLHAIREH